MESWISKMVGFMILYIIFYVLFTLYLIYNFYENIIGYNSSSKEPVKYTTKIHFVIYWLLNGCYYFFFIIFLFCLFFIITMFIIWFIIQYIIPAIIILPIPFIPFFIPIPIRQILLALPPFPNLIEAGIMSLIENIIYCFTTIETLTKQFQNSSYHIADFTRSYIDNMLSAYNIKRNVDDYFDNNITPNVVKPDIPQQTDEIEENKEYQLEIDKRNANQYYQNTLKIINLEIKDCIDKNSIIITPDMSYPARINADIQNSGISVKCNLESLKSNFKAITATY